MLLRRIVQSSIDAAGIGTRDQATAELAIRYATLIDRAAAAGKYRRALDWLAELEDADHRHVQTIRQALAAHTVMSDLGPKLLAALESLRLTPHARDAAGLAGAINPGSAGAQPNNVLDQLADARARKSGAAAVDASAP